MPDISLFLNYSNYNAGRPVINLIIQQTGPGRSTPIQTCLPGIRFEHHGLISLFQHISWLIVNLFWFRAMMSQQVSPLLTVQNSLPDCVSAQLDTADSTPGQLTVLGQLPALDNVIDGGRCAKGRNPQNAEERSDTEDNHCGLVARLTCWLYGLRLASEAGECC